MKPGQVIEKEVVTAGSHLVGELARIGKIRKTRPGYGESAVYALSEVLGRVTASPQASAIVAHVLTGPRAGGAATRNDKQQKRADKKARNRK